MIDLTDAQIKRLIEDIAGTVFTCEGCGWTLSEDERFDPPDVGDSDEPIELDADYCDDCGPDQVE